MIDRRAFLSMLAAAPFAPKALVIPPADIVRTTKFVVSAAPPTLNLEMILKAARALQAAPIPDNLMVHMDTIRAINRRIDEEILRGFYA